MKEIRRVAVLGAGNGGHAMAADLTLAGFDVNLYELPQFAGNLNAIREAGGIYISGVVREGYAQLNCVTSDIGEAIRGVDLILVVTQALAHEPLADLCAPHIEPGQAIVLFPGSGGALLFAHRLRSPDIPVAETVTLPYACRVTAPAHVHVHAGPGIREVLGVFPARTTPQVVQAVRHLYPTACEAAHALEPALYNPNVLLHPVGTLFNLGRIEYAAGEFWMYKEGFTPSVWRIIDALDGEKMAILAKLGQEPIPYRAHYEYRYGNQWEDFASASSKGPASANTRYISEDVPIGMVLWSSLGQLLGVPTPTADAIIQIASAVHRVDYRAHGRTMKQLGLDQMSREELLRYLQTGENQRR
ncbi:MAG: NAD/NADP octopine/nopaline dehydrogenase family protein [Candidatus Promineofilum sp.]|nr:NAD/NADP octopine/nopaline dehydrogenase family protein [Promineifilum sp.]